MKKLSLLLLSILLLSCTGNVGKSHPENSLPLLSGSWKLVSAKTIAGKDTVVTKVAL